RASEYRLSYGDKRVTYDEEDTFEHILSVTSHNDALLAYYYLDAENKRWMTTLSPTGTYSPTRRASGTSARPLTTARETSRSVETKSSRIFHQCYLKCCKLQNLTPLNNVIALENGKRLDFCVDRIKYVEWPPILNALSCDLSLHSVCIRCRQQVKTVLEQIDCERLAKTVNKRAVILTNFMLTNLVEAICQLLSSTTLLATLLFEGLPLKIPYLSSFNEALVANSSLQHLFLGRCLIGDAGCLALCKTYQKIHRYSENWVHTLRYRLPDLDTMAGLRRNCGLTEKASMAALHMMQSNTTLVVLDLRHNPEVSMESLSKIRAAVRDNERGLDPQFSWLGNVSGCSSNVRVAKLAPMKNGVINDRVASNTRVGVVKHLNKTNAVKKERHKPTSNGKSDIVEEVIEPAHRDDDDEFEKIRVNIVAKKAQSTHVKLMDNVKMKKTTKSAHLLGKSKKNDAGVSVKT
ncbi:Adipose triglyceride lipase brummer, partial [Operophtera brumata]